MTVLSGKCYKAFIDSGATISLLRYSAYKNIEDCYKTPIQPTTAKLNTADGSPMSALGMTALHLRIDILNSHIILSFAIGYQLQNSFLALIYKTKFPSLMLGTRKGTVTFKRKENS